MKFRSGCAIQALIVCFASPLTAHSASAEEATAAASARVTITKKDANEKVVAVRTVDVSKAILLAAQLAPGAVSNDRAAVKTLVITHN